MTAECVDSESTLLAETTEANVCVRVLRSVAEVEHERALWETWPGHRDSDIDFYLMILKSTPEAQRPHVVVLYLNHRPEAMLIGRLEQQRLAFKLGYVGLFRRSARCLTFVHGANRGNATPENCEILVREVLRSLKQGEADVAIFEPLPMDSPLLHQVLRMPSILSRDAAQQPQEHNFMVLPGSIDEVYARMSHDRRKDMRRKFKKFEAIPGGPPNIVCYRRECDLPRVFSDAEEVAKKTYQRGLRVGFADSAGVRKRLELAARKGWLRAYLLYLGDRPCAFWIGMLYGDSFVGEYVGYDPEFRLHSPGMFLMMRVIERFCRRPDGDVVRELDLGFGQAEYKSTLCNHLAHERIAFVFAPTWNGVVLKFFRSTTTVLDKAARKALTSAKVLPRLKRAWRDHLARRR